MGADRPGDIKYLVDFLNPEVGVVTAVGISHLEFFKDKKQIAKEKSFLVKYSQERRPGGSELRRRGSEENGGRDEGRKNILWIFRRGGCPGFGYFFRI